MMSELNPRWNGKPGRMEVWYTTVTDPVTGTGLWLHHELVAPTSGAAAYTHGFAALFPPDSSPVLERFGPRPVAEAAVFGCGDVTMTGSRLAGRAGDIGWELSYGGGGEPLYTFPRWAWRSGLLPAAQIVAVPQARHHGTVTVGDRVLSLDGALGATARIYGHGLARTWAWLHADLGDGDVLEIVAAGAQRRGWRWLPLLSFVRLRHQGVDWPAGDPLLRSWRYQAAISLPEWTVTGRGLSVTVRQPPQRTVSVDYADTDGSAVLCHNSEAADADISVQLPGGRVRTWRLHGTAHAEIGVRRA